eukprot:CAMPEP_0203746594 /NCGR_PEP_ID=MMETSP0098-20131031/1994_1 /ASSEMBLY_ACC=CAM_ASM_000208 /TAXON_ID=96639 /ORGANISM=" , Strain NY0313808BC1" /LENGTH=517 /DNA_ID=CAMNT_0050634749 /DNA_START=294 /DNA_END=1847 /DNA_ORIENTATION=-
MVLVDEWTAYLIGGGFLSQGDSEFTHLNDVWKLNLKSFQWSKVPTGGDEFEARRGHSTCVVDGLLVVFGGINSSGLLNDVLILDPTTNNWSKPTCSGSRPTGRRGHTAVASRNRSKMFVFGGLLSNLLEMLVPKVYVLDLDTFNWSTTTICHSGAGFRHLSSPAMFDFRHLSSPAMFTGVLTKQENLIVFGGNSRAAALAFTGDMFGRDWSCITIEDTPSLWSCCEVSNQTEYPARFCHTMTLMNDSERIFVYGGCDRESSHDTVLFNFVENRYEPVHIVGKAPPSRNAHTMVAFARDKFLLFGGGKYPDAYMDDLYVAEVAVVDDYHKKTSSESPHLFQPAGGEIIKLLTNTGDVIRAPAEVLVKADYFRALLYGGFKESGTKSIMLPNNMSREDCVHLLEFLQTSNLPKLEYDVLVRLLYLSRQLVCSSLSQACEKHLVGMISEQNLCAILSIADELSCPFLLAECLYAVYDFFGVVSKNRSEEFGENGPALLASGGFKDLSLSLQDEVRACMGF